MDNSYEEIEIDTTVTHPQDPEYYSLKQVKDSEIRYRAVTEYAGRLFTEDVARVIVDRTADGKKPLFITDDEGKRYWSPDMDCDNMYAEIMGGYEGLYGKQKVTKVFIISMSEETALAYVLCTIGPDKDVYNVECKLEKTADGWRIADCAYTDMFRFQNWSGTNEWMNEGVYYVSALDEYDEALNNPPTSDSDASRAVIFAGVGALALWGAVAVVNRRRRPSL